MKYRKLLLIGAIAATLVIPTQAAVYGTLTQDMFFDIEGNQVVKASGTGVSILDEDEYNYLIRVNEEKNDLVSKSLVKLPGTITTANKNAAIINSTGQKADVLGRVNEGDMVMVFAKEDNFYKVKIDNTVGYIYNSSIDESKLSNIIEESKSISKGEEVVAYAKQFLGGPYVYGGNSLQSGVDCSGFTQQIMKHFNISIGRSSRDQYANSGHFVSEADIRPGDIVCYGNGSVNHVGIYVGNGQIIHANDESTGIIMSSLHYGKPIMGIKRVIN